MMSESQPATPENGAAPLRALCIARHCFLSEHIARCFAAMGLATTNAVGLDSAAESINGSPDVVICDYDLLASLPLERWERDTLLSTTPVIAVSLTRQPEELQLLDSNGIAGFLYLPTLETTSALEILHAAAARPRYSLSSRASAPRTIARS
jgi:hypothetical protein